MRSILTLLMLFVSGITPCLYASDIVDGIGIYFDEEGTINCLPDSTNYPFSTTAYLLLKNISTVSGISGWEGKLGYNPELFITLQALYGNGLNVADYPEFIVGLESPLAAESLILLAELLIYVTGPGDIYFTSSTIPSIPGSVKPIYTKGNDPAALIQMEYSFGGYNCPVASIGSYQCPEEYEEEMMYSPLFLPGWEQVDPNNTEEEMICGSTESLTIGSKSFMSMLHNSDLCFIGTVQSSEIECYDTDTYRRGVAVVKFSADHIFWGIDANIFTIIIDAIDIEGCVGHANFPPRPTPGELLPGFKYLVVVNYLKGNFFAAPFGIFHYDGNELRCPGDLHFEFEDPLSKIDFVERKIDYWNQYNNSDYVVYGRMEFRTDNIYQISVVHTFKGELYNDNVDIVLEKYTHDGYTLPKPVMVNGEYYLIFLNINSNGAIVPLEGRWSVIHLKNRQFFSDRDLRLRSLNAIISIPE